MNECGRVEVSVDGEQVEQNRIESWHVWQARSKTLVPTRIRQRLPIPISVPPLPPSVSEAQGEGNKRDRAAPEPGAQETQDSHHEVGGAGVGQEVEGGGARPKSGYLEQSVDTQDGLRWSVM